MTRAAVRPAREREASGSHAKIAAQAGSIPSAMRPLNWYCRRSWLVVASNAGSASHPSWYLNLARRPECAIEVGRERIEVRAEALQGEERERAWKRVVSLAPGYGKYATDTDREIPIVRLTPRG